MAKTIPPSVNDFLTTLHTWKQEYQALRQVLISCGLTEQIKWMHPCYMHKKKNIALIHGFNDYIALSFFKGALMKDPAKALIQPTENSQAGRQLRFANLKEIQERDGLIKEYLLEAIDLEKAGAKIAYKEVKEFEWPIELKEKFDADPEFAKAFHALTPGRQKGYLLHFAGAKQAKSRAERIEKYKERILTGKGLRDCICGLSKRMPNCDGSHKELL